MTASEIIDNQHIPYFNRYDIVVRYMAIEHYYGLNDFGLDLYRAMQIYRTGVADVEGFKSLVCSFERNGYLENNPIVLFKGGTLRDGSHRLACALYFGVKDIPVVRLKRFKGVNYSIGWFRKHKLPTDEIEEGLKRMLIKAGIFLVVTLWPPISKCFNEIKEKISGVLASDTILMKEEEFVSFIKHQYSIDGANKGNIDKKINFMSEYEKRVMILLVNFGNPRYRIKKKTQEPISQVAEQVKKDIRGTYSDSIDGYIKDVIIHISDNYEHSQRIIDGFERFFRQN